MMNILFNKIAPIGYKIKKKILSLYPIGIIFHVLIIYYTLTGVFYYGIRKVH